MAKLSFVATTILGDEIELENVMSYELNRDADAACDGLRLTISNDEMTQELTKIKAFLGGKLVFNGNIDCQRDSTNNGIECFIYARSTASVLLDNEAEPTSYFSPSVSSLFYANASGFGFKSKLPELTSEHSYLVNKGVSCYGAINNFVRGLTGKSIVVNPENELLIPNGVGAINVSSLGIISEKRIINRGDLLSRIDYKINGDNRYCHHIKSAFLEQRGISSTKKINLSSLPRWQKEFNASTELTKAASTYYKAEIVADGCIMPQLYDKAVGKSKLQAYNDYYVTSVCVILDSKGERTRITLCKNIDLEAISYVAE